MATTNLDLFSARISDRVVKATEIPALAGSVAGGYSPVSDSALIPIADTAYARTVRLHESGHAIYSRRIPMSSADAGYIAQAIEDAKIHLLLRTTASARRDEVYAATSDMRITRKKIRRKDPDRALQGLFMIRAAAILSKDVSSAVGVSALREAATLYHPQGPELLASILAEIKAGNMLQAKALASLFMRGESAESAESAPEKSSRSDLDQDSLGSGGTNSQASDSESESESESEKGDSDSDGEGDGEGEGDKPGDGTGSGPAPSKPTGEAHVARGEAHKDPFSGFGSDSSSSHDVPEKPTLKAPESVKAIPNSMLGGSRDMYIPKPVKIAESEKLREESRRDSEDGTVTVIACRAGEELDLKGIPWPMMYVHALSPNVSRKVKGRGHNVYRSTDQGIKIRANRLALNAANKTGGSRLFETRHLGGTVLIDASGSMKLTDSSLYEIAEKFPAGKVAYYSGRVDGWIYGIGTHPSAEALELGWSGDLVIYAANGKIRKDHGDDLPKRWNGNLVDYAAILWLLRQPAPRYMLFDRGATGTAEMYQKSTELLEQAEAQKKITVFRTMPQMMAAVRKLR